MKARFQKTTWRAVGGIAASFLLVVSFQNCGKAGFDSNLDGELDLGSDAALTAKYGNTTAEKVAKIPFAFEATFDTITYNSCATPKIVGQDGYFSLKAGAYATGGIKLKTDFFDYVDQNFSPVYPETSLSVEQYKEFLQDSSINNRLTPNLSIRAKNSLTDIYYNQNTGALTLFKDIIPMVAELTNPLVSESFINKGVNAGYFPFSPEKRVMEGSLSFNQDENQASDFRGKLSNQATLALTYTPPNQEIYKVAAASTTYPVKTAYGRGHSLSFSSYPGTTTNSSINRVLSGVTEMDLASPTVSGRAWTCNRVYKVVRAGDDAAIYCPAHTQEELFPTTIPVTQAKLDEAARIRKELEIARRHLRADQWEVNVSRGCVVPKTGVSCYDETKTLPNIPTVEYDVTKGCFPVTSGAQCLHYISICIR